MRRVLVVLAVVVAVAAGAGYALWYVPTKRAVAIGTGMLAKQMCSCLFVAGRSRADCRADQFASMDPIEVEVLSAPDGVRAFVPLLGERTATRSAGGGCTLQ